MPQFNPHNYMDPNPTYRFHNGEYYLYTPTKTQSYDWGSVGTGGTVEKLTPEQVRSYGLNHNNTFRAVIDPDTWAKNGRYTPDEIKSGVQSAFAGFDKENKTGWQNQLDALVKQASDLYNADPTRGTKVFGDVWNKFRYNPANDKGIQEIQAANNNPRPEFTSQEQANVYGQTGKVTTADQRNEMARGGVTTQPSVMNSGDFAVAYKQKFGSDPTTQEVTDWANAGRPSVDSITPAKSPAGGTSYSVKSGDTLSQIARKFGTTLNAILAANPGIKNPNLIYPNQKIVVPAVSSDVDPNKAINDAQSKLVNDLNKATSKDSKSDITVTKDSEEKAGADADASTFKMPSSSDLYNSLMNSTEIKDLNTKLIDYKKQLDQLNADELAIEQDIRKQVQGEAPDSLIRAMAAEKARALYPKKLAIQAEATAVQSQLTQALENAKQQFTLKLQDQENGLKYLDTLIAGGTKLTAEQYKLADDALGYGSGFAKAYFNTKEKAKNAQTAEDQIKVATNLFNLLEKIPVGQKITIDGTEYEGTDTDDEDIITYKETDKNGNVLILSYNKKTKKVETVSTGIKERVPGGGGGGGGNNSDASGLPKGFWSAIDKAKNELQQGEPWGNVWNRIKMQFPKVTPAQIDNALGTSWRDGGAYQKWKAAKEGNDDGDNLID